MGIVAPVMNDACSEHNHRTVPATSSAVPMRLMGGRRSRLTLSFLPGPFKMVCKDGARCDDIDTNTLIGVVKCRDLRQTDDSCFSRDVGCQIGDAVKSRERSHIDDGPSA